MLLKEISILLKKEIILEWRQRYALNGMLLYVVSTIMVVYMSFNLKGSTLQPVTWNALFWIIMLFTAVNAIAKSFNQERYGRFIYYYTLIRIKIIGIITGKLRMAIKVALLPAFEAIPDTKVIVEEKPAAPKTITKTNRPISFTGFPRIRE